MWPETYIFPFFIDLFFFSLSFLALPYYADIGSQQFHENNKTNFIKKMKARTRNSYNQVPGLTRDTIMESDKNKRKHHTHESKKVSSYMLSFDLVIVQTDKDSIGSLTSYVQVSLINKSCFIFLFVYLLKTNMQCKYLVNCIPWP